MSWLLVAAVSECSVNEQLLAIPNIGVGKDSSTALESIPRQAGSVGIPGGDIPGVLVQRLLLRLQLALMA